MRAGFAEMRYNESAAMGVTIRHNDRALEALNIMIIPQNLPARMAGVYEIRNTADGKRYVGSSVDLRRRTHKHKNLLKKGMHGNAHLQNAWNKYGEEAFVFRVILFCDASNTYAYEQRCLDAMMPEYNKSDTAKGSNGRKGKSWSEEHKEKIGLLSKAWWSSEENKQMATQARVNRAVSEEAREKISKALTGRKASEEARKKQSAIRKGKKIPALVGSTPWNKGKKFGPSWITGKKHTEETKQKMRDAWARRKANQESED